MGTFIKYSISTLLTGIFFFSFSQTRVASTGLWETPATWSSSELPGDDEVIHIPEGITVTLTDDHVLDNTVLVIDGTLSMSYHSCGPLCTDYGSLELTGPNSAVIVTETGEIEDANFLGGALFGASHIEVNGEKEWSAGPCVAGCGNNVGTYTSSEETAWPSSASNPLPVTLTNFWLESNGGNVSLFWQTSSELNNSHFEVQRSLDGTSFDAIGQVAGNGTTTLAQDYKFSDQNPTSFAYYRLKQIDFDGKFEFSKTLTNSQRLSSNQELKIFPNPSSGPVRLESNADISNFILYDHQGRVIVESQHTTSEVAQAEINEALERGESGSYILSSTVGKKTLRARIIRR